MEAWLEMENCQNLVIKVNFSFFKLSLKAGDIKQNSFFIISYLDDLKITMVKSEKCGLSISVVVKMSLSYF